MCKSTMTYTTSGQDYLFQAKNALDDPVSNCSIPYTDFKPFIVKYILKRWQVSWDQQIHSKLHEMHSLVCMTPCSYYK
jgi:hypothetical protein